MIGAKRELKGSFGGGISGSRHQPDGITLRRCSFCAGEHYPFEWPYLAGLYDGAVFDNICLASSSLWHRNVLSMSVPRAEVLLTKSPQVSHGLSVTSKRAFPVAFGQYNRRESPTQTSATALLQVASGEVWGRSPRNGLGPAVQAYRGRLQNHRGIDFTTLIDPHRSESSPFEVRWYLSIDEGVEHRCKDGEDFACIPAIVTNLQP